MDIKFKMYITMMQLERSIDLYIKESSVESRNSCSTIINKTSLFYLFKSHKSHHSSTLAEILLQS